MKCKSCYTNLMPTARFCHHCGKSVAVKGVVCDSCNHLNPEQARFCEQCGHTINIQYEPKPNVTPEYQLDFNDIPTLPAQIAEAFTVALRYAIEQENNRGNETKILDIFRSSDFTRKYLEEATIEMTQQFEVLFEAEKIAAFELIERITDYRFTLLLERFFIDYCRPLLPFPLSRDILQAAIADKPNSVHSLVLAYLQPNEEKHTIYTNAVEVPLSKLQNAQRHFYAPSSNETLLFFLDNTFFGSGKEGLILTQHAIYWKNSFHKAAMLSYHQIQSIRFFADRIELNDIYLNISPAFNYKLYKFLCRAQYF